LGRLGAPSLDARRVLTAYWARTDARVRTWHIWQVNPFTLAWNGLRDAKNLAVFLFVMQTERF